MNKKEKRVWETQYECTGCARWYYSESDADKCCGHGVYELNVCSWCGEHVDHCNCDDTADPFSHRGRHTSSLVNNEGFHLKLSPETMGVVVQSGRFVVFYNQVHINSADVEPLPDSDYEKSLQKARMVPVEQHISVEDVPLSINKIRTVLRRGWTLLNDNEPAMKKFNDSLKRRSQETVEQTNEQETN